MSNLKRQMTRITEQANRNGVTLIIEESQMSKITEHANKGDTLSFSLEYSRIFVRNDEYGIYDEININWRKKERKEK